jgi:methyl-accepting chemotaxis protein
MKMSDVRISVRLGAAFAGVLGLTVAITALGMSEMGRIDKAKQTMKAAVHVNDLAHSWLAGIETNAVRTYARVRSDNPDDRRYFSDTMKQGSARITDIQSKLEPLITGDGKPLFETVAEKRKSYSAIRDSAFELQRAGPATDAQVASLVENRMVPAMTAYIAAVQRVAAYQSAVFEQADRAIDEVYARAWSLMLVLGTTAVIAGAVLAWLLSNSIVKPLGYAVRLAQTVAAGDLTSRIEVRSRDELGQLQSALKSMNESLLKTVLEVRTGTDVVATASQQIAAGNLDLSSRTEAQASSLEQTAASLEELTSTVRQNADNARQAKLLTTSASAIAQRGGAVVSEVVTTMASINDSSRKISDIIGVIDGIAFQTNILALNAAVEAARAGEQGRGFAVVAGEVRNLAQRSAGAAREIKALIQDSVAKVDAGGRLVDEAGATMSDIVGAITRVTDLMAQIASANIEQSGGIEQINIAVTQMDQVTQQNAALVEQAAAAANAMQLQAATLAQVVGAFIVDRGHPPSTPARAAHRAGARRAALALTPPSAREDA